MPGPDPDLRGPGRLPDDPTGIVEPHDVLAAEEFAIPAIRTRMSEAGSRANKRAAIVASGTAALWLLGRRRRH